MAFLSANDPAYTRRLNLSDTSMPMDAKPAPLVATMDGRAYLVSPGLRDVTWDRGQEGEIEYTGGALDYLWVDPKTGQEHYLSDYADKGAKLHYGESPVMNRGGSGDGAWIDSMSDADPLKYSGATNYFDVAEQADDADSMGYLTRINPTVRKQIFDAAGYSGGLSGMSPEDVARIERAMYKIDPMSFGGGFSEAGGDMGMDPSVGFGQASMGGVDPILGRATANPMGSYFRNIENLKWSPEFGLYNDGSAGFVKRKKQSAWEQGAPFIAAAAALMGGAALLGPAMAGGAGAAGAVGTGAELGFGGMLADAGVTSGALEGLGGTVFSGGELFANGALNLTENAYANSAITGALKNAAMSGITGRPITGQGLLTGAALGAASPYISSSLGNFGDLGASSAIGTGGELGFGGMLTDANIASGAGLASDSALGIGAMDAASYGGETGFFDGLMNKIDSIPSLTGSNRMDNLLMNAGKGLLSPNAGQQQSQSGGGGGLLSQPMNNAGMYARGGNPWFSLQGGK